MTNDELEKLKAAVAQGNEAQQKIIYLRYAAAYLTEGVCRLRVTAYNEKGPSPELTLTEEEHAAVRKLLLDSFNKRLKAAEQAFADKKVSLP